MSHSTIYKRNLQRRARSQENLGDHRPPFIRVMAGLGFFTTSTMDSLFCNHNKIFETNKNSDDIERKSGNYKKYSSNDTINTLNHEVPLTLIGMVCAGRLASSCLLSPFVQGYAQGGSLLLLSVKTSKIIPFNVRSAYAALFMTVSFATRFRTKSTTRSNLNINKGQNVVSAVKMPK